MSTARIPLKNIILTSGQAEYKVSSGTLLDTQHWISDGLGGQIPSTRSWVIHLHDALPFGALDGNKMAFKSGRYSGECFARTLDQLQGTGPLTGRD